MGMHLLRFLLDCYLALVLGISGMAKIDRPRLFAVTLRRHGILPGWSIDPGSRVFPWVEALVAYALIANVVPMFIAIATLVFFGGFLAIEGILVVTKRTADCGCYGGAHRQQVDGTSVATSMLLVVFAAVHLRLVAHEGSVDWQWRLVAGIAFVIAGLWLVQRSVTRHRMSHRLAQSGWQSAPGLPQEKYTPHTP